MLCLEDCLDFCDLDHEEIEAIAEHEHIPIIVAAELGTELLKSPAGVRCLGSMLLDNVGNALQRGQKARAERLAAVYRRFHASHPLSSSSH